MGTLPARWMPLVLAMVFGSAIAINAHTLQVGRADHHVVPRTRADDRVIVPPGGRVRQTARPSGELLNAFTVLLIPDDLPPHRPRARLTVEDRRGTILAESSSARQQTDQQGATLEFQLVPPVALPKTFVTFIIENRGPKAFHLATAPDDAYENGTLEQADGEPQHRDLVWGFATPTRASLPTRIGASLAAALTLAWGVLESTRWKTPGIWRAAGVLAVLAVPAGMLGVLADPAAWGISDWDLYFTTHDLYRAALLRFHQIPFWNPAVCGGTAGLADPEFPVFGPGFLLELLAGVPWGLRLSLLGHLATGGLGMLLLGRAVGLSARGSFLAALVAFTSSSIPLRFVEGHVSWFAVTWIPWVVWAWIRAYRRQSGTVLPAVFLVLMLFEGGIYPLFYLLGGFALWPWLLKDRRAALLTSVRAVLWTTGLAGIKLLPTLQWVQTYQDQVFATSAFTFPHLWQIFLGRHLHGADVFPHQGGGWHEYGSYLGPMVLILLALGSTRAKTSRIVRALFVVALFGLIVSSLGPWLAPVLDTLSILPRSNLSRLVLVVTLTGALLAGFGFDRLLRFFPHRQARLVSVVVVSLIALDLFTLAVPISFQAFRVPPLGLSVRAPSPLLHTKDRHEIRIDGTDYPRMYANARAGFGSLAACTPIGPRPAVADWRELATPTGVTVADADARATLDAWTPNRMVVRVTTPRPTTVTLQTNAAQGWQVNGKPLPETRGLLRTTVPAGEQALVFTYRPPGLPTGIAVSVITLLLALKSHHPNTKNSGATALHSRV
ncbi:MAG: hypothetical protein G01um101438_571 [Parcubacteria group bacterium Gr01-1014_38]|nr:MAG: hypothetical protein G01um101438_571 [Parcubacteria group bacterium Gr01-1014_38]